MIFGRANRSLITVSTSEKPKAPTSTGMSRQAAGEIGDCRR